MPWTLLFVVAGCMLSIGVFHAPWFSNETRDQRFAFKGITITLILAALFGARLYLTAPTAIELINERLGQLISNRTAAPSENVSAPPDAQPPSPTTIPNATPPATLPPPSTPSPSVAPTPTTYPTPSETRPPLKPFQAEFQNRGFLPDTRKSYDFELLDIPRQKVPIAVGLVEHPDRVDDRGVELLVYIPSLGDWHIRDVSGRVLQNYDEIVGFLRTEFEKDKTRSTLLRGGHLKLARTIHFYCDALVPVGFVEQLQKGAAAQGLELYWHGPSHP